MTQSPELHIAAATYTVQEGDTLNTIAEHFYGDPNRWPIIYEANRAIIGDDPNRLFAGMLLTIPEINADPSPNWLGIGGPISESPAAAFYPTPGAPNPFHVYARNHNGRLLQQISVLINDMGAPLSGITGSPAVTKRGEALHVAVRGGDSHLYQIYWDGRRWSDWENRGGDLASGPALASWNSGRLDVFARGVFNNLIHTWWDISTGWVGWEDVNPKLQVQYEIVFQPTAVSWGEHWISVFAVRAGDGHLLHSYWNGMHWYGWEDLGGVLTATPTAVARGPHRLNVFGRGSDGRIYHKGYEINRWSEWQLIDDLVIASAPAAALAPQGIVLFARGANDALLARERVFVP